MRDLRDWEGDRERWIDLEREKKNEQVKSGFTDKQKIKLENRLEIPFFKIFNPTKKEKLTHSYFTVWIRWFELIKLLNFFDTFTNRYQIYYYFLPLTKTKKNMKKNVINQYLNFKFLTFNITYNKVKLGNKKIYNWQLTPIKYYIWT